MGTTSTQPDDPAFAQREADFAKLKAKWRVCRPHELQIECARTVHKYLIDGLLPERSLGLMVGDSGLGKSPLCYQMGLCVAAGISFLGLPTQQARVLYLDFENGLQDVNTLVQRLSGHLGLSAPPRDDLILWNFNDSTSDWNGLKIFELIRDFKPGLVFTDTISSLNLKVEKDNERASEFYEQCRRVIRDCGCSIMNLHHRRKPPSSRPGETVVLQSLEDDHNPQSWFHQARGASALVYGADIRLGVDDPGTSAAARSEIEVVLRGYGRLRGEIPTIHLARVRDDEGEPLGYRKVAAVQLLCNPEQETTFNKLRECFSFKEAKQAYSRQDEATSEFLKKCISKGILKKIARGSYEKVKVAE